MPDVYGMFKSAIKCYESEKSLADEANGHNVKRIAELESQLTNIESEFTQCKQHRDRFIEERNSARVEVNTLRAENARIRDELQITRKRLDEYENAGILQRIRNLFRVGAARD